MFLEVVLFRFIGTDSVRLRQYKFYTTKYYKAYILLIYTKVYIHCKNDSCGMHKHISYNTLVSRIEWYIILPLYNGFDLGQTDRRTPPCLPIRGFCLLPGGAFLDEYEIVQTQNAPSGLSSLPRDQGGKADLDYIEL